MNLFLRRNKIKLINLSGLIIVACSYPALAGGISLGGTRIIYPQDADQVSLAVSDTDSHNKFLIQSWVSDENGNKSSDFVVTPPLFVIQPNNENTLRIMFTSQKKLPTDRESIYYLNSKAIPGSTAKKANSTNGNTLQIASQDIIKLFVRPANLPTTSNQAPGSLSCHTQGKDIVVTNPSPYYVTMVNIKAGGKGIHNTMVPPMANKNITIPSGGDSNMEYQTINDYGSMTPKLKCPIK